MQKLIKNHWYREAGEPFARAKILSHDIHPEGLDVDRIRFFEVGNLNQNRISVTLLVYLEAVDNFTSKVVKKNSFIWKRAFIFISRPAS